MTLLFPGMTVRHRYPFRSTLEFAGGNLGSPQDWDRLREGDPNFGFGGSREAWIQRAESFNSLARQAGEIVRLLHGWGVEKLVSVGVGTAVLEYHIQSLDPALLLRCGDYAPSSLEVLRRFFRECRSIELMDLRRTNWITDPEHEAVLLNRVDTELSDAEWRAVFSELRAKHVRRILLIPCGLLTPAALGREVLTLGRALVRRLPLTNAGYLRTESRLQQLFSPGFVRTEVRPVGDLPIWVLERV